jgi:hypothetical protein
MSEAAPATAQTTTPPPASPETPPATTPPPQPADAALAAKKAAEAEQIRLRGLAIRKQREEERKKLADENAALKAEREALAKEAAEAKKWRQRALQDPEALKDLYGDKWYESLTKAKLGDDSNLQVKAMREELMGEVESLKQQLEEARKAKEAEATQAKTAEEQAEQEALQDLHAEAQEFVGAKKDTYASVATAGLHAEVAKRAHAAFMEGKTRTIDLDAAAASVEAELDKVIEAVLATPKWAKKYRAAAAEPAKRKEEAPQWQPRRSIGTDMTPGSAPPPTGKLTPEQKRERALKALEQLGAKS